MPTYAFEDVATAYCARHGETLVAAVGKGAFKETFHIRRADGSSAALKVYGPACSAERTTREIDAMSRCSHPNIATLTSVAPFDMNGTTHLITIEEYLEGGTLADKLSSSLLQRDELLEIGERLIEALGHIAQLDLVHRDLKPDNIMFRADHATPVVVDFGLVRDLQQLSLTQTWLQQGPGTPLFAPAEQLLNEKQLVDWRADQFSLGVVLSFAMFGRHPYQEGGESLDLVVQRVGNRGHQSAEFLDATAQSRIPVLVKMTKPWPVHRYRLPTDLLRDWREQRNY